METNIPNARDNFIMNSTKMNNAVSNLETSIDKMKRIMNTLVGALFICGLMLCGFCFVVAHLANEVIIERQKNTLLAEYYEYSITDYKCRMALTTTEYGSPAHKSLSQDLLSNAVHLDIVMSKLKVYEAGPYKKGK